MGEKDLFYDCSARIPLIVYDPRQTADATRGTDSEALVESIDLAPTFLEGFGGAPMPHVLEGRSLAPLLRGEVVEWRDFCVSEYDYANRDARRPLGVDQAEARLTMIFDGRWKYIHVEGMRPILFDLETDPDELIDLGAVSDHSHQIARLSEMHFNWARRHHARTVLSDQAVEAMTDQQEPPGIFIGFWNKDDLEAAGRRMPDHVVG